MPRIQTTQSDQFDHPRHDFAVPGTRGGFVILPEKPAASPTPWTWYAPTFVTGDYLLPKDLHRWYFKPLLEAGFAIGGVDVDESWGSPAGRVGFTAYHATVVREFGLDAKACLMPQSRGGLMLLNWAAEHPEYARCIAAIYPVCDITRPRRIEQIAHAHGVASEEILATLPDNNPLDRLAPLAEAGVPILTVHGAEDDVVPLETNSAELERRYKALGGLVRLVVIPDKGHEEVPEFFECHAVLDFLLAQGATVRVQ